MSTESLPQFPSDAVPVRHTDEVLLNARIDTVRDGVLPVISESAEFNSYSVWQRDTVRRLEKSLAPDQTIDLPTRTGKSYLLRQIAAKCQEQGVRTAIIAPRLHILREHAEGLEGAQIPYCNEGLNVSLGDTDSPVWLLSTQGIAVNRDMDPSETDAVDVVLIDEGHKALGAATVQGIRNLFPNAVRMTFTATPDYAVNRSVTDEYGAKIITHSIVEAINEGNVPPVRAFLYKTEARIDNLDPTYPEFTPRELRRLARFNARNMAIVDMAEDLVSQGRQGLITTIPGEDLLHADILEKALGERRVVGEDGTERAIRARVVRGSDTDLEDVLVDFELGNIDVLLYCDLLREGFTTNAASFLLNGRPRTSVVSLTQDIGRVLEPKEGEMIVVDYLDESIKRQCTVYDILELDRATQAVAMGPSSDDRTEENKSAARHTYMRGLFRADIVERFKQYDSLLLTELYYEPESQNPYEKKQLAFRREQARELTKQTKIWEKVLKEAGLEPELPEDLFMAKPESAKLALIDTESPNEGYIANLLDDKKGWRLRRNAEAWPGLEHDPIIVPPVSVPGDWIDALHPQPRVVEDVIDPQDIVTGPGSNLQLLLIDSALAKLPEREQNILRLRFGLDGNQERMTLDEIGTMKGVSRTWISQIEARALAMLRSPSRDVGLRGFYNEDHGDEPTRERILAYRALIAAGVDPSRPNSREASAQMESISQSKRIEQNKRLIAQRNAYYRTLSMTFFGRPDAYDVDGAHMVIDTIARELEGYNPNDYQAHQRIAKILERDVDRPDLLKALTVFEESNHSFYYMPPEERHRHKKTLEEQARRMKAKLLSAVTGTSRKPS